MLLEMRGRHLWRSNFAPLLCKYERLTFWQHDVTSFFSEPLLLLIRGKTLPDNSTFERIAGSSSCLGANDTGLWNLYTTGIFSRGRWFPDPRKFLGSKVQSWNEQCSRLHIYDITVRFVLFNQVKEPSTCLGV